VKFFRFRISISRFPAHILIASLFLWSLACGPEDYQKPIQGFQNAANTVIAADRTFLSNENTIEQNLYIDQQVFERKAFGPADVASRIIISSAEIKLRTEALDALSQYTTNLATLAQGKAAPSTGQNMKTSGDNLQTSATTASSQAGSNKTQSDFNKKFSGVATAAAAAIGAVAQLVMARKARNEIKQSVNATDKDITALIRLIGDDAQGSYLRQRSQLGAYGVQLYNDYKCEIASDDRSAPDADGVKCFRREKGVQADPVILLTLADRIKSLQLQQAALENANPAPAIAAMEKAHEALVAYVNASQDPKKLSDLITDVKNFVSAAEPLGQAMQKLVAAAK
jgi:hypothetical protein